MAFYEEVLAAHRRNGLEQSRSRREDSTPVSSAGARYQSQNPTESTVIRFFARKVDKLRGQLSDRLLEFKPYIKPLPIEGCPIRFFYATAQAASWYDPLNEKNRRELEWLVANIDLEGQKIIDAGAYHGLYATIFAKAAGDLGEVVAVDPVSSNQAVIEVNLAINGLSGRNRELRR